MVSLSPRPRGGYTGKLGRSRKSPEARSRMGRRMRRPIIVCPPAIVLLIVSNPSLSEAKR